VNDSWAIILFLLFPQRMESISFLPQ